MQNGIQLTLRKVQLYMFKMCSEVTHKVRKNVKGCSEWELLPVIAHKGGRHCLNWMVVQVVEEGQSGCVKLGPWMGSTVGPMS